MPNVRDPASRLSDLVDRLEPKLRRKFLEAMFVAKSRLTLEVLISYLEAGRVEDAVEVVERVVAGFAADLHAALVESGRATAALVISRAVDVAFRFDETDPRFVQAARAARLDLIREFTDEQRRAVHQAILDGVQSGLNPRQQARNLRGSIGLTQRQQAAVGNYRRLLEQSSPEALQRKLRDRRFDRTVAEAVDHGAAIPRAQVDVMVERYRERMLQFRAETIARTEALRVVHAGHDEAFEQAFAAQDLERGQVIREWNTAKDERVRRDPSHRTMHGQKRQVGEPFVDGAGNKLMRPGDPNAPASTTVRCRCSVGTRIVLLPNELEGISIDVRVYEPPPPAILSA